MKILFTGSSAFTGYWFIKELTEKGHEVVATFRGNADNYTGVRADRVKRLLAICRPVFNCDFGSSAFFDLLEREPRWDLFCHHAAEVTNYKSPDFEVIAALAGNTRNLSQALKMLKAGGCSRVLLTGSVFEHNEGAGSTPLSAFSPYGLSKGLTAEVFRYYTHVTAMRLGKFVIPNPFGPFEEPRFTAYLIKSWFEGKTPSVATPAYVRDNIHVSLLAKAYVEFAENLPEAPGFEKFNPSGYAESQGAFAQRFAGAIRERLDMPCKLDLKLQQEFPEPRVRINTDGLDLAKLTWDESIAWDECANYYRDLYKQKP